MRLEALRLISGRREQVGDNEAKAARHDVLVEFILGHRARRSLF